MRFSPVIFSVDFVIEWPKRWLGLCNAPAAGAAFNGCASKFLAGLVGVPLSGVDQRSCFHSGCKKRVANLHLREWVLWLCARPGVLWCWYVFFDLKHKSSLSVLVVDWTFIVLQINKSKKSCQTETVGFEGLWHRWQRKKTHTAYILPCVCVCAHIMIIGVLSCAWLCQSIKSQ